MRTVPERSNAVRILSVLVAFIAGPLSAYHMAPLLSPDSGFVHAIAPLVFALIMFFGILLWIGLGVIKVLMGGFRHKARRKETIDQPETSGRRLVPPGYKSFIVLGILIGTLLGIIGGVLSSASFSSALVGWIGLGLAYGMLLWLGAHHGYLPFPDDD